MATTIGAARAETGVSEAAVQPNDMDWLVPFALIVAVEVLIAGTVELSVTYSLLAFTAATALATAWLLLWVVRSIRNEVEHPISALKNILWDNRGRILCTVAGIQVAAFGISAFSVLKAELPSHVPFYADQPLAEIDVWVFGQDAWRWSAEYFGFFRRPISLIYGAWLITQFTLFTAVVMSRPSRLKTQAIIAYGLMWLFLGVFLAYACSSVGPVFYDRAYGGQRFAGLEEWLRPETLERFAADYLWSRHVTGDISVGGGISAMPSLHVAGTLWLALIIKRAFPKLALLGWAYLAIIFLGSIMLGWHYASDGLVAIAGTMLAWMLAGRILGWRHSPVLARLSGTPRSGA